MWIMSITYVCKGRQCLSLRWNHFVQYKTCVHEEDIVYVK